MTSLSAQKNVSMMKSIAVLEVLILEAAQEVVQEVALEAAQEVVLIQEHLLTVVVSAVRVVLEDRYLPVCI